MCQMPKRDGGPKLTFSLMGLEEVGGCSRHQPIGVTTGRSGVHAQGDGGAVMGERE